ncbi:MAG: ThuA domain-containing protein, partial [Rikenellaceae bacterium]
MKKLLMLTVAICLCSMAMAAKPIKALIVTGQNNHNWPVSHVILKQILEKDNYKVDLAISPKTGEDMSGFKPAFNDYELVVLDYNGDSWCKQTNDQFLEYVRAGKGVVIYHAANNAFNSWDEYEKIIALGGWGGRGKES